MLKQQTEFPLAQATAKVVAGQAGAWGKDIRGQKKKLLEAFKTITGKIFNLTQQMFVDYETRGKCDDIVSGSGAGVVIDSAA